MYSMKRTSMARRGDAVQHVCVARAPGEREHSLGAQGVQTDRDSEEAGGAERLRGALEQDAVGREREIGQLALDSEQ
jgi:hypothetical protein